MTLHLCASPDVLRRIARVLAVTALAVGEAAYEASTAATICEILERTEGPAPPSVASLGREIGGVGTAVIPCLLDAIVANACPRSECGESLTAEHREVLCAGLERLGRAAFEPQLERMAAAGPDERLGVLRVLEHLGENRDMRFAALAATTREFDDELQDALEDTVGAILRRTAGYKECGRVIREAEFGAQLALVGVLGSSQSIRAIETLASILGFKTELDPVVLSQIGHAAASTIASLPASVGASVRPYLDASDLQTLREAAVASARLQDSASIESLISLLHHDSRVVRDSAHWALKELTGLSYDHVAVNWERWRENEFEWLETEAPLLLEQLLEGDRSRSPRALNALSGHSLWKDEIAERVHSLLWHEDAQVRRSACAALGRLGSRSSVSFLVTALEDSDSTVVQSASSALGAITGESIDEREAWALRFRKELQ